MNRSRYHLIIPALTIVFGFSPLVGTSRAQTVAINAVGSSAMFVELGQAASASTAASPAGLGATCVWSTKTIGVVAATDNSTNGGGAADYGNAFVAWTPVNGSCSLTNSTTTIYAYLSTDSVVGVRCLFNSCALSNTGSGTASAGLILGTANEVPLAPGVATALNASPVVNVAATDIRPEDAEFATARALTPCGQPVASGSQYLGLGYTNGESVLSY